MQWATKTQSGTVRRTLARGRYPLNSFSFREREDTPSEQGFLSLPETHSLLPALLRATALRTCMGFGVFDCLKHVDCSFAENVSCRLSAAPPDNLCKFACGKLEADGKPILSVKPSFPVRPAAPAAFAAQHGAFTCVSRAKALPPLPFFMRFAQQQNAFTICYSATNLSAVVPIVAALSLYVCTCPAGTFMLPAVSFSQSLKASLKAGKV